MNSALSTGSAFGLLSSGFPTVERAAPGGSAVDAAVSVVKEESPERALQWGMLRRAEGPYMTLAA